MKQILRKIKKAYKAKSMLSGSRGSDSSTSEQKKMVKEDKSEQMKLLLGKISETSPKQLEKIMHSYLEGNRQHNNATIREITVALEKYINFMQSTNELGMDISETLKVRKPFLGMLGEFSHRTKELKSIHQDLVKIKSTKKMIDNDKVAMTKLQESVDRKELSALEITLSCYHRELYYKWQKLKHSNNLEGLHAFQCEIKVRKHSLDQFQKLVSRRMNFAVKKTDQNVSFIGERTASSIGKSGNKNAVLEKWMGFEPNKSKRPGEQISVTPVTPSLGSTRITSPQNEFKKRATRIPSTSKEQPSQMLRNRMKSRVTRRKSKDDNNTPNGADTKVSRAQNSKRPYQALNIIQDSTLNRDESWIFTDSPLPDIDDIFQGMFQPINPSNDIIYHLDETEEPLSFSNNHTEVAQSTERQVNSTSQFDSNGNSCNQEDMNIDSDD